MTITKCSYLPIKHFLFYRYLLFLSDPGIPIYGSWSLKLATTPCADLTDMTLADEDNDSIPTDDVNRAIIGNVALQVWLPAGQACSAGLKPLFSFNSICIIFSRRDSSSSRINTLGPLCLWQCFVNQFIPFLKIGMKWLQRWIMSQRFFSEMWKFETRYFFFCNTLSNIERTVFI